MQESTTKYHRGLGLGLWCIKSLSVISRRSVLLVEETRLPREKHQHVASR